MTTCPVIGGLPNLYAEHHVQVALSSADDHPDQVRFHSMIDVASNVYRAIVKGAHGSVPPSVLSKANCIAVLPNVITGAIVIGGTHGTGLVSCKNDLGNWSQPAAITLNNASIGLQAGAKATDLVLFFQTKEAEEALKKGDFSMGADVSAVAGKYDSGFDSAGAGIVAFNRIEGFYAGVSISGGKIAKDQGEIARYYGTNVDFRALLNNTNYPDSAEYTKKLTILFP
jgi:lipid-binding SYLF domain-containing protein